MSETQRLRPATADEIAESLSFALRYAGRKRGRHADDMMARITAEGLARHLELSGYVVMKRPALVTFGTPDCESAPKRDPA